MLLAVLIGTQVHPSTFQRKGDTLLAEGMYQQAAAQYQLASEGYLKRGDPNTAKILRDRANRYRTVIELYQETEAPKNENLARLEPVSGCYLGVNIEREAATRDPKAFNNLVGKRHAMFFRYRRYGMPFPKQEAAYLKKARAAMQIAFEPTSLSQVRDDEYLRGFAKDIRDSGIPVFVRFAGEMNGTWVPYNGDPEAYKRAFRTVARVIRETASNAAMVWCPNQIPEEPIDQYYPGQDVVDWVGVNFYSVIYSDADQNRPGEWRWPTDSVDYVYKKYSTRHPIMVGEWAATHQSSVDNKLRPDFAQLKIRQFFETVPLRYPRLKAASWLSFNALLHAKAGRQLNNYSLYDNDIVGKSYAFAIADPSYLEGVATGASGRAFKLVGKSAKQGPVVAFFRSYDARCRLDVRVNGKAVPLTAKQVRAEFSLPTGNASVVLKVIDGSGRVALTRTFELKVTAE